MDTSEGFCTHSDTLIQAYPTSRNPCKKSDMIALIGETRRMPPMEVAFYCFININTAMKCHSVIFDSTGSGVGGLRYQLYAWDHFGIKGQLLSLCSLVFHW